MIDKVETYKTPWSSVGLITAKRTYCRPTSEVGEAKESWEEVIDRVMDATETQLHVGFTDAESAKLKRYMMELKGLVAGRFLWQLGTHTVDRLGLASLQNCAFSVIDEPVRPFTWAMDMLMLGVGVGINIQREHVYKLPKVKADFVPPTRQDDASADYIVPDTREGWVKLLEKTLKAAFDKRHVSTFTYSTQLIRGKGVKIKSFGGVASGPEELVLGIDAIAGVLKQRTGKQPRPIDCLDIIDIIGQVVVAGNVRRSAILALGDPDDFQFLRAKRWDLGNIPNWRANSNNSVVCDDFADLPEEFWKGYNGSGEPYGMINLKLARSCGRLGETQYKDKDVLGANPCITGDTLIAVADGRNAVAIKDLVGTTYPVYTTNSDKKVVIGNSSRTWKTRENAEIWALTLDDGSVLKATPDHMIMTRTGAYCALRDLTPGTSLMPFNSYISNKHYRQIASAASARVYVKNDKQASDVSRYNHKVVSSCFLGYENVYDMTVDITNNFGVITSKQDDRALTSSGVFVHNCAEQFLADKETCCLAEVALPLIESEAQFLDVAKLLYRVAKHSLHMKCHQKETESIVNKNMRMGLGISGYLQATEEQRGWCSNVYVALRKYDVEYSKKMGWPVSIKLTTCKPSGTMSLLSGITPGVHPGYAQYMLRRIRIASNSSLVDVVKAHKYPVEFVRGFDGTPDRNTVVASFPYAYPVGTKLAADMSAIDQLEVVKRAQTEWSDNGVSCTVYYHKEELPAIREYLAKNFNKTFKALSFLLHDDHGFDQAPYEEITEEEYNRLVKSTSIIDDIVEADDDANGSECASGICPVR